MAPKAKPATRKRKRDPRPTMDHQRSIAKTEQRAQTPSSMQFSDMPQDMGLVPFAEDAKMPKKRWKYWT